MLLCSYKALQEYKNKKVQVHCIKLTQKQVTIEKVICNLNFKIRQLLIYKHIYLFRT